MNAECPPGQFDMYITIYLGVLRILVISRPPNVTPSPSPCSPYREWMQNFFPVNLICIWPYKKAISVGTPSFLGPLTLGYAPLTLEISSAILLRKAGPIRKHPHLYCEPSKKSQKITLKNANFRKNRKRAVSGPPSKACKKKLGASWKS